MNDMRTKISVTGGAASGWSGDPGRLDDAVQQIPNGYQILEGNYGAGTYSGFVLSPPAKHRRRIWPYMRKGQGGKIASDGDIKRSIAKNLGDMVRVCYRRLLRFVGHR